MTWTFLLVMSAVVAWQVFSNVLWYRATRKDILEARKERLHAERIEAIRESMRNKRRYIRSACNLMANSKSSDKEESARMYVLAASRELRRLKVLLFGVKK